MNHVHFSLNRWFEDSSNVASKSGVKLLKRIILNMSSNCHSLPCSSPCHSFVRYYSVVWSGYLKSALSGMRSRLKTEWSPREFKWNEKEYKGSVHEWNRFVDYHLFFLNLLTFFFSNESDLRTTWYLAIVHTTDLFLMYVITSSSYRGYT